MILGTATDYINMSNLLVALATGRSVTEAAVDDGGSGYVVGDILTVSGGTATIAAQLEVTSVSSGVVDGIRVYNQGSYTADPTDPVSVTGGTGTGAEINLTLADMGWTAERDEVRSGSDRDVILNGVGGGTDSIYVGWRTFFAAIGGYYNWELQGFTGYESGKDQNEQPGARAGGWYDESTAALRSGCYMVLANTSFNFWASITPYRIILVVKIGSYYFPMYLGWGNRYATDTEYPYPLIIAGPAANPERIATDTGAISTISDPWTDLNANTSGPMMVLMPDYTWATVTHCRGSGSPDFAVVVSPCRLPPLSSTGETPQDKYYVTNSAVNFSYLFKTTAGAAQVTIYPTDGDDERPLLPLVLIQNDPAVQVLMEVSDVFVIFAQGGVASEDRTFIGSDGYRIFQNCNRTELHSFIAIKE